MKPFGSTLIAVACRISQPGSREHPFPRLVLFGQQVRRCLASIEPLRNAWHFATALRGEMHWRTYSQSQYAEYFARHADPYGYDTHEFHKQNFKTATEMLSELGRNFERALEIGCAQGAMTERLAPLCNQLLAVDYVPIALERARARCRGNHISFMLWDLEADPVPGQFDLIVITGVFASFRGRRAISRASDKLVNALAPAGYLLYGDWVGNRVTRRIQNSQLGCLLLFRPVKILRIIAAHPTLVEVARRDPEMYLLALFQKRATTDPQTVRYLL